MKILIDLTSLADNFSGIERYALNISKQMIIQDNINRYILVFKNRVYDEFAELLDKDNIETKVIKGNNKLIFNQIILPYNLYKIKADKYIFLAFPSPILFYKKGIINTIHDLTAFLFPETMNLKSKIYFKYSIINAVKKSELILTVSNSSKDDLIDKFGENLKVEVISNGISNVFTNFNSLEKEKIYEKYNLPDEYILCLGTIEPRKNLKLLIEAYIDLKREGLELPKLILVGRKGWKLEDEFKGINIEKYKSDIVFTGFVDDNDLPYIYENAQFFVFPSLYEGFGIPVIESLYMKTPVIISNIKSLTEITNYKAKTFISNDKEDLKNKIREYINLSTSALKKEAISVRKEIIKYNWEQEAKKLILLVG